MTLQSKRRSPRIEVRNACKNIKIIDTDPKTVEPKPVNAPLKSFDVPKDILDAVENGNQKKIKLDRDVTENNYVKHFRTVLWLEEAEDMVHKRHFDQSDVTVQADEKGTFIFRSSNMMKNLFIHDQVSLLLKGTKKSYAGHVKEVHKSFIRFSLNESWTTNQLVKMKFDISFAPSRNEFIKMHNDLDKFDSLKSNVEGSKGEISLIDVVFPKPKLQHEMKAPKIDVDYGDELPYNLNKRQQEAIVNVLRSTCRPAPYLITGSTRTGKTETIVESVLQIYQRDTDAKIFICNAEMGLDDITKRILDSHQVNRTDVVRVVSKNRSYPIPTEIELVTGNIDEVKSKNKLSNSRIVIATSDLDIINQIGFKFDFVFLDDAGDMSETETLIPLGLLKEDGSFTMAGDLSWSDCIASSIYADKNGLFNSMLQRIGRSQVYQVRGPNDLDSRYITDLQVYCKINTICRVDNMMLCYHQEFCPPNKNQSYCCPMKVLDLKFPLVFHYHPPEYANCCKCVRPVQHFYQARMHPNSFDTFSHDGQEYRIRGFNMDSSHCNIFKAEPIFPEDRELIIVTPKNTGLLKIDFLLENEKLASVNSSGRLLVIAITDNWSLVQNSATSRSMNIVHIMHNNYDKSFLGELLRLRASDS